MVDGVESLWKVDDNDIIKEPIVLTDWPIVSGLSC